MRMEDTGIMYRLFMAQSFSVKYGITCTETIETSSSLSNSINISVSEGFDFEWVSASVCVEASETYI